MAFARASSISFCVLYRGFSSMEPDSDRNFQPVDPGSSFLPRDLSRELGRPPRSDRCERAEFLSKKESPLEREPLTLCGRFGWRSARPPP